MQETAEFLQKHFFLFQQMPLIRVEKLCVDNIKYQRCKRAGENIALEGMGADCLYISRRGLFVS